MVVVEVESMYFSSLTDKSPILEEVNGDDVHAICNDYQGVN